MHCPSSLSTQVNSVARGVIRSGQGVSATALWVARESSGHPKTVPRCPRVDRTNRTGEIIAKQKVNRFRDISSVPPVSQISIDLADHRDKKCLLDLKMRPKVALFGRIFRSSW